MYVKKIIEYVYNYAEYIVSDGNNELKCVCMSVPLPDGRAPKNGMKITKIFAFSTNNVSIKKITDKKKMKDSIVKLVFSSLGYRLRGRVCDVDNSTIEIFGFKISLQDDFPDGLGKKIKNGDFVQFSVDRLDCMLENDFPKAE